uniref:Globin family profile domain-containing protein n=2 Tax=Zooxanthella nutricula TaxID=1333877 RepID=A0A7S2QH07_9DINO
MVRREVYLKFFALAPAGQDYFKQSTTRLHFIADRVVEMTVELYKDPKHMVEDISALGLRHVGYGIPTELFGPFVTACVQVVRTLTDDDLAEEAFRWSLSLISRILTRVITEGSTIVMKAINANSSKQVRKAISCAPRGKRAMWMLNVQVGTQSISPLIWAIETGSLEAGKAMIQDLLTIRADRDRYYYGMDTLFDRHPDMIQKLCNDAPVLLNPLLDGLIWRSRFAEGGFRRVNYYVKHLVIDGEGHFSKALEWLIGNGDPKIICHPIIVMVTDIVWSRLAFRVFLFGKSWFLFTLCVFVVAQAVIKHLATPEETTLALRTFVFACRCFIYNASMSQWIYFHVKHTYQDIRAGRTFRLLNLPMPTYLKNWQDIASLILTVLLIFMFAIEPILTCVPKAYDDFPGRGLFTQACPAADSTRFMYSLFSMCAMMMYFLLLIDLSVFSTRISAFVLMVFRVLSEVGLFLFALSFVLVSFACAVSSLEHSNQDFAGLVESAQTLLKVSLGMWGGSHFDELQRDEALFGAVFVYVVVTVVFLVNMLTAQLNSAYQSTYLDMVGFARLNRGKIVIESMPSVSRRRWESVSKSLRLDEKCEFGEGDVGLPGGIQVQEAAGLNPTTVDMIRRFGGSTSVAAQWPEEQDDNDDDDRFARVERLIEKAMKRMKGAGGSGRTRVGGTSGAGAGESGSAGLSGDKDAVQGSGEAASVSERGSSD